MFLCPHLYSLYFALITTSKYCTGLTIPVPAMDWTAMADSRSREEEVGWAVEMILERVKCFESKFSDKKDSDTHSKWTLEKAKLVEE